MSAFLGLIKAVVSLIVGGEPCLHARTNLMQASHCPDCGDKVRIEWAFTVCKGCDAKRIAERSFFGKIKPVQAFCRHCGEEGFRIIKRDHIEAYELLYAVSLLSTDYREPIAEPVQPVIRKPFVRVENVSNAFVDAEVVHPGQSNKTRSTFKDNTFNWNKPETTSPSKKLMLLT